MRKLNGPILLLAAMASALMACGSATSGEGVAETGREELKSAVVKAPPQDTTTAIAATSKVSVAQGVVPPAPRRASPAEVKALQAEIAAQRAKLIAKSVSD